MEQAGAAHACQVLCRRRGRQVGLAHASVGKPVIMPTPLLLAAIGPDCDLLRAGYLRRSQQVQYTPPRRLARHSTPSCRPVRLLRQGTSVKSKINTTCRYMGKTVIEWTGWAAAAAGAAAPSCGGRHYARLPSTGPQFRP